MHISLLGLSAVSLLLAPITAAETVLGSYIFSRHGDRTSKSTPPTSLTELGYQQVYLTGSYYRDRYLNSSSSSQILDISPDTYKASQMAASAPAEAVLQNSAMGFLQGLYPPAGKAAQATLRNGTVIEAPMGGYQIITIDTVKDGAASENTGWLQSVGDCYNAKISSNSYFDSEEYKDFLNSTTDFYKSLIPMINSTFSEEDTTFKNAYTIFDYLNVANIHNETFPSDDLLTNATYDRLLQLSNAHEFGLAFNVSDTIRAVSGSTLAGQILTALNETVASKGKKPMLNIQFGAYATFLSLFGLTKMTSFDSKFTGVPDYASTMAFELVTNSSSSSFPDASDISVRFLFNNGTVIPGSADTAPKSYPLFGQDNILLPWSDFVSKMEDISLISQEDWCKACGSSTPECSASGDGSSASNKSDESGSGSNGISKPVAGVIGALVTLAVVFGVQALVFLAGGFRLARKGAATPSASTGGEAAKAAA